MGQRECAEQRNTAIFPPVNNPNNAQGQTQGQGIPGFANQPNNQPQWGQPPTSQPPAPNQGFSQNGFPQGEHAPSGNNYDGNGSTAVSADTKSNPIGAKGVASIVGILVLLGGASYVWSNHHNGQKNDEAAPTTSVRQFKGATPSANPTPGQETTEPAPRKVAINPTVNNDDTATDTTEESDDSDSSNNNSTSSSAGECDTPGADGKTYQIVVEKAILTAPMLKKCSSATTRPPKAMEAGRESAAAISNSGIPPPTIGAAFHPRMPPQKEKTAPLAVAMKN